MSKVKVHRKEHGAPMPYPSTQPPPPVSPHVHKLGSSPNPILWGFYEVHRHDRSLAPLSTCLPSQEKRGWA